MMSDTSPEPASHTLLHSPWELRGLRVRNRVMVAPMCMYSAESDGKATDYHLVHLGRFALGGAGIVTVEATAIEKGGRISYRDLGAWSDDQIPGLRRIAEFLGSHGAVPAIQLAHAGRKASAQPPWEGQRPLLPGDASAGTEPWIALAASADSYGEGWPTPREMREQDLERNVSHWVDAALRAERAGFRVIELHGAHGYLLHSFTSAISNSRTDRYGGSLENRLRFPLRVVRAVRAALGEQTVLAYRLSVTDGALGGSDLDEIVAIASKLDSAGVDLIDCSSGGIIADRSVDTRIRRGFGFHTPYSRRIRDAVDAAVASVGLILDPLQAEAILEAGDADLIVVGREMLNNPNWAYTGLRPGTESLRSRDLQRWRGEHLETGFWLEAREPLLRQLREQGEDPHSNYERIVQDIEARLSEGRSA